MCVIKKKLICSTASTGYSYYKSGDYCGFVYWDEITAAVTENRFATERECLDICKYKNATQSTTVHTTPTASSTVSTKSTTKLPTTTSIATTTIKPHRERNTYMDIAGRPECTLQYHTGNCL